MLETCTGSKAALRAAEITPEPFMVLLLSALKDLSDDSINAKLKNNCLPPCITPCRVCLLSSPMGAVFWCKLLGQQSTDFFQQGMPRGCFLTGRQINTGLSRVCRRKGLKRKTFLAFFYLYLKRGFYRDDVHLDFVGNI